MEINIEYVYRKNREKNISTTGSRFYLHSLHGYNKSLKSLCFLCGDCFCVSPRDGEVFVFIQLFASAEFLNDFWYLLGSWSKLFLVMISHIWLALMADPECVRRRFMTVLLYQSVVIFTITTIKEPRAATMGRAEFG